MATGGGGGVGDGGNSEVRGTGTCVRDDNSGLNPNRQKGFAPTFNNRIETPTLSGMRAKQQSIVARFMTFFQRKNTMVIEMYEAAFYRQKPTMDKIADFIYSDLCPTAELRKEVVDVQFHPVKMLLFVKFSSEVWRDAVMARVQSAGGVGWTAYRVKVRAYSLDAQVKSIKLLGVSPGSDES